MNYGIPSNISKAVVKGLQKSMQRIFGNGLETFVPQSVLKHGEALDGVALFACTKILNQSIGSQAICDNYGCLETLRTQQYSFDS